MEKGPTLLEIKILDLDALGRFNPLLRCVQILLVGMKYWDIFRKFICSNI